MSEKRINWEFLIGIAMLLVGVAGINIPLFMHSDAKMMTITDNMRQDFNRFHNEIKDEMRDFHGRLISIEERGKK